jgi:outer membrane protein assembly factor BamB
MHTLGIAPDGKTLWHHAKVPGLAAYVPSPVAFDQWFFLVTDSGNASCLDAKTGTPLWSQKLGKHHFPSAILAQQNIYWLSDDGACFVVKAADKYQQVSKNELGEHCNASPVISHGNLFIRTDQNLWCIGK